MKQSNAHPEYYALPPDELVALRNSAIRYFYRRVCAVAEKNMSQTGTVSGAHWNAMRQVMAQMHISEDGEVANE